MGAQGQNEGIRVLDDFVCKAIYPGNAPDIDEAHEGQNDDMRVVEELVFAMPGKNAPQLADAGLPVVLNEPLQRLAKELASALVCQSDRVDVLAKFQREVIAQIAALEKSLKQRSM